MDDFVTIARILKARGIRGEVAADLLTDFPERFKAVQAVRVVRGGQQYCEKIERFWFHQHRVILKFEGRNTPEEVAELIPGDVQIPEQDRVELPEGYFFQDQLIGCRLFQQDEELGTVESVLELAAGVVNLVCRTDSGREFMVPLVSHFVVRIDVEAKTIEVNLPPGLTEL